VKESASKVRDPTIHRPTPLLGTLWMTPVMRSYCLTFCDVSSADATAEAAARSAIAFTRDYIEYVRSAMGKAAEDWLDFDVAYQQTDWSKYKDMPAFDNNNRGNAYRIFLEMEQSQFKNQKPAQ